MRVLDSELATHTRQKTKTRQNRLFYSRFFTKRKSIKKARKIEKALNFETVFRRPFASNKSHCVDKLSISTRTIITFYVIL